MSNCPICKSELVKNYEYRSEWGLEESSYECKGHYSEIFAYGGTEICIGDFITGFHYSDPPEKRKQLSRLIQVIADAYNDGDVSEETVDTRNSNDDEDDWGLDE